MPAQTTPRRHPPKAPARPAKLESVPPRAASPAPSAERPKPAAIGQRNPARRWQRGQAPQRKPHASPAVRKFARELGVDLSQDQGHGIERANLPQRRASISSNPRWRRSGNPAHRHRFELAAWPKVDFAQLR